MFLIIPVISGHMSLEVYVIYVHKWIFYFLYFLFLGGSIIRQFPDDLPVSCHCILLMKQSNVVYLCILFTTVIVCWFFTLIHILVIYACEEKSVCVVLVCFIGTYVYYVIVPSRCVSGSESWLSLCRKLRMIPVLIVFFFYSIGVGRLSLNTHLPRSWLLSDNSLVLIYTSFMYTLNRSNVLQTFMLSVR